MTHIGSNCKTEPAASTPRVLLLVPSYAKRNIEADVAADRHPKMDYNALAESLNADIADYGVVDGDRRLFVKLARRIGRDAALAMHGYMRRRDYDVVYSNGENVSIPFASLLMFARRRPGHVLIGHHLSPKKKRFFLRVLHGRMDSIFVYSAIQKEIAENTLGIPGSKLNLIPFHADHRFYRPMQVVEQHMICSAGLEWRDYPTMIEAVNGLNVEVKLAAASPWSHHANEVEKRELPPNVSARRYEYCDLRDLYAASKFVVVPLYENDFQAGVTTILEAMAMGKAVVASRTIGQRDVIDHEVNGLYVEPGNVAELRNAILRLLNDPDLTARLGRNARKTVEERMTLDHWTESIKHAVYAAARQV